MNDRLEIPACGLVGEHDWAEFLPVDGPRGVEDARAEPRGDRVRGFGSRAGDAVRELVRVETGGAAAPEALQDVALAGGDTASQCDGQHFVTGGGGPAPPRAYVRVFYPSIPALCLAAVSVFLRSIAIVSGPTPPGTGVRAPAICSTSG